MIKCWRIVVTTMSEGNEMKEYRSNAMTYSEARGQVDYYRVRGSQAELEELSEQTTKQLMEIRDVKQCRAERRAAQAASR